MALVVTADGLDQVVQILRDDGRRVIGPVARDGVITHDEITTAAELPAGWTEEQEGGTYRLIPTGTAEVFGYSSPSTSWKRFLHPERTLLLTAKRTESSVVVTEPEPGFHPMAFFGIRSCDLAALAILDDVFTHPTAQDPSYGAKRADVFIVAVGCGTPGNTCFCASMDTGPFPSSGYDLSVTELFEDDRHEFMIDSGSESGAAVLAKLERVMAGSSRQATRADFDSGEAIREQSVALMGRTLNPADPPLAAANLDHPRWDDVASRCLACGNCTMVCPTCFCSTTEDVTDLSGTDAERWRVWDSCFTIDFSHLAGGAVRTSTKSRYRQWLLHKLVTWHDQFGSSGCVGCGRCITWCPVGIDLTAEIAALAKSQKAPTP